ncbi:hypothetical protein [Burkholderia perseverans]|uniref:hypothetical protein n=1 Tax=Burkholderia perseverans TaxID=2615214 RepID=UPI001FED6CDA|nr:hypothetical protein [Burkholderia perseverans]
MSTKLCHRCNDAAGEGKNCRSCGAPLTGLFPTYYGDTPAQRAAKAAETMAATNSARVHAVDQRNQELEARMSEGAGALNQARAVINQAHAMISQLGTQIQERDATIAAQQQEIAELDAERRRQRKLVWAAERAGDEATASGQQRSLFVTNFARFATNPEDLWITKDQFDFWAGPISSVGVLACKYAGALGHHDTIFKLNRDGSLAEGRTLDSDMLERVAAAVCRHEPAGPESGPALALSAEEQDDFFDLLRCVLAAAYPEAEPARIADIAQSVTRGDFIDAFGALAHDMAFGRFASIDDAHARLLDSLAFCASLRFERFELRFAGRPSGLREAAEAGALLSFIVALIVNTAAEGAARFPWLFVRQTMAATFESFREMNAAGVSSSAAHAARLVLDFLNADEAESWAHAIATIAVAGGDEPFSGQAAVESDGAIFIGEAWAATHGIKQAALVDTLFQAWGADPRNAALHRAIDLKIQALAERFACSLAFRLGDDAG